MIKKQNMSRAVNRKRGFFSISAVAEMFSVHPQTVRLYEKEGLITPKRSDGNTRLFSEEDVNRLEEIIYLTHELGINLAGVEMILKLKKQIAKLQHEMNKAFKETQDELIKQEEVSKKIIKKNAQKLMQMKKNTHLVETKESTSEQADLNAEPIDTNWEIDYEEE